MVVWDFDGRKHYCLQLFTRCTISLCSVLAKKNHPNVSFQIQEKTSSEILDNLFVGLLAIKLFNWEKNGRSCYWNDHSDIYHHFFVYAAIAPSCSDLYKSGVRQDGVYTVDPDGLGSFQVRCDMSTDGGGWTVFQRRQDGSQDFYLGWSDYKAGFGDLNGEFWLGLDKIHRLTKSGQSVLRIDMTDFTDAKFYAKYANFSIADKNNEYRLNIGSFSGNWMSEWRWWNLHWSRQRW